MLNACRWDFTANREAGGNFAKQTLPLVDAAERIFIMSTGDMGATSTPSTTSRDVLYDLSGTTIDEFEVTPQNEQNHSPASGMFPDEFYYLA